MRSLLVGLVGIVAASCGPKAPVSTATAANVSEGGERIPFLSTSAPADVVGHMVQRGKDNLLLVAPELRPGCRVALESRPVSESFEKVEKFSKAGGASVGFGVFRVGADLALADEVEFKFATTQVVTVRQTGDCGEEVVKRAYLGRGSMRFLSARSGGGTVSVAGVGVGGTASKSRQDVLRFDDERIYAIEVGRLAASKAPLEVEIDAPRELKDKEQLELKVFSNRPAYLLLVSVAESGEAYLLAPSAVVKSPRAAGRDAPFVYPTPAATAANLVLQAQLPAGASETRESVVVYAFEDEADLRDILPLTALSRTFTLLSSSALEKRVSARLLSLPEHRWSRATLQYRISR